MQKVTRIGNIEDIYKCQGLLMTVQYALPDVMAFLLKERGAIKAEKDLQDIGRVIAKRMLMVWTPKNVDPISVSKEMKKKFFKGTKMPKAKIIEKYYRGPRKILLSDKDCPVCPKKSEEIEISELHYCTAISSFTETILNHLIENKLTPYAKATCKTVASVGSGADHCDMLIELEY